MPGIAAAEATFSEDEAVGRFRLFSSLFLFFHASGGTLVQ